MNVGGQTGHNGGKSVVGSVFLRCELFPAGSFFREPSKNAQNAGAGARGGLILQDQVADKKNKMNADGTIEMAIDVVKDEEGQ